MSSSTSSTTTVTYQPGDVVWSEYGAGVIVGLRGDDDAGAGIHPTTTTDSNNHFYLVRLWRQPKKSIGSASLAYLQKRSILEKLPAAPGMIAPLLKKEDKQSSDPTDGKSRVVDHYDDQIEQNDNNVLVHAYFPDSRTYLVSHLKKKKDTAQSALPGAPKLWTVAQNEVGPAPAAKFYPLLEALMVRGDQTAQTAAHFFQQESTRNFISQTQQTIQAKLASAANESDNVGPQIQSLQQTVQEAVVAHKPSEQQIKQVLEMVKDQELTELLLNCRKRLEQLVQTDIPKATQMALEKTGILIKIESHDDGTADAASASFAASMDASRKAALDALQQWLDETQKQHGLVIDPNVAGAQLEQIKTQFTNQFSQTFDSLATAAKSDAGLNELFQSVASRTTVWQQATGRLLQTRSASLFLEGASRLHARASAILQAQWTGGGEIGIKLTKAFTEKDAALARLKSIQLGHAIKNRLVRAIEVRSESLGGLDGIIAGALAKGQELTGGKQATDQIHSLMAQLQTSASTATTNAHETLISLLSHRSMYRDVALKRIERVFCELSNQFGDDLSPEDMYALARGEGGTAKLFQPIAKRAMLQIEKQLSLAEEQVKDNETMVQVLKQVRKITSGELTVAALMEELVSILNDDKIVSVSETVFQRGEEVLDVIEGVSTNAVYKDALKIVEKAGLSKDTMMKEIEKIDVNQLLDTAGSAVTDEKKRMQLLSSATDTALDFVLRILPSMPVPPFDGVKDGLLYNISNLSMEGFKVRKEDIQIELAGMRATKRREASIRRLPSTNSVGTGSEVSTDYESAEEWDTAEMRRGDSTDAEGAMDIENVKTTIKATELLIIDVRRILATMNNVAWSFEQTYLPYLKGGGLADIKLSDGAIRLQFELRRRKKENTKDEWEPVLCLKDRTCSIGQMELSLQGAGSLTWIFNKLASVFKGPLRDYVVRTIVKVLASQSGWILGQMNSLLSPYWDLILSTAKLNMEDLLEADETVVVKAVTETGPTIKELVWFERLPLGMNLLMNDESGQLRVVDFPRGSQARLVAEKRNLNPDIFKGSTIVAVNGTAFEDQDELFEALKDPSRPKAIQFRLAESAESERVRRFVEGKRIPSHDEDDERLAGPRTFTTRVVNFVQESELGIVLEPAPDNCGLVVQGFVEGTGGILSPAQQSHEIMIGDLLTHVNGQLVVGTDGEGRTKTVEILGQVAHKRPLSLSFVKSYLFREILDKPDSLVGQCNGGPTEMVLVERKLKNGARRVLIESFNPVSGAVENSGILIGDHLVFVNGIPVGAGARWMGERLPLLEEVYEMLSTKSFYPIGLTFARPRAAGGAASRWMTKNEKPLSDFDADTFSVTFDEPNYMGCFFDITEEGDIVITDFNSVPGLFHRKLSRYADAGGKFHLAFDSINGHFVPSYATKNMVMSALKRSWNNDKRVEVVLCDDERKEYVQSRK